jgi:hypothetical protein
MCVLFGFGNALNCLLEDGAEDVAYCSNCADWATAGSILAGANEAAEAYCHRIFLNCARHPACSGVAWSAKNFSRVLL